MKDKLEFVKNQVIKLAKSYYEESGRNVQINVIMFYGKSFEH